MTLIYEPTRAKDTLRAELTLHFVGHRKTISSSAAALEVICEYEYMAWTIGQKITEQSDFFRELYYQQHSGTPLPAAFLGR